MFSFFTSSISHFSQVTLVRYIRTLIKNIVLQGISFIVLAWLVSVAYATYTTIAPSSIATGQPVSVALMQQIKDNLDDLNTRVSVLVSAGWSIWVWQAWTNVTASRSAGVTYTNSTGKPIVLNVLWYTGWGWGGYVYAIVNWNTIPIGNWNVAGWSYPFAWSIIIPVWATYLVNLSITYTVWAPYLNSWYELR